MDLQLLKPTEVQNVLKCSLPYVYRLAESGRLKHVRIPSIEPHGTRRKNVIRFRKDDVLEFIETNYLK
jgi:excisionase family DNA binding protein